jgi:small-conductance mechanosensitive channel
MITIFGWHPLWTWHDLGAPVASLVALPVALGVLCFVVWLRRPAAVKHAPDELRPPRPSRVLCAVIGVISGAAIVAVLLVIGRYWTGPTLARWAWAWGVRWMLPVLVVVIVLILDIRRETKHEPASLEPRGTGDGTVDGSGEAAGGTAVLGAPPAQ